MPEAHLQKRLVNYATLITSFLAVFVGVGVLYLASKDAVFGRHPNVREVIREVGAAVLVLGFVTIFWEMIAKRAFTDELLAKVGIGSDISAAGLIGVTSNFHRNIDWGELFKNTRELDIFFAYGGTWRNSHIHDLQELARRPDAQLRVVLPDRDDDAIVSDMARRFDNTEAAVSQKIGDSEDAFRAIGSTADCRGHVEVWRLARTPVFSFYRFDDVIVSALYHHRQNRDAVPAFRVEKGGTLYEFFNTELNMMLAPNTGYARRIFCNRGH